MIPEDPRVGTSLSQYRLEARLGAGGMGVVYRAYDTRLKRHVAIKMVPPIDSWGGGSRQLLHEARSACALNHPHVCTVHDVCETDHQTYIVMEYIDGEPLSWLIPAGGLPTARAVSLALQIADALAHAHERGIIHRDLKAGNVVVGRSGVAKVLDFGLATRIDGPALDEVTHSREPLTSDESIAGTLPYMAPELLSGGPATVLSDIWSFGVLLYKMVSGSLPFSGETGYVVTAAVLHSPPAPLPPDLRPALRGIIERCLAKRPGDRFRSAADLHQALRAVAADGHQEAGAEKSTVVLPRSRRRRSVLRLAIVLGCLAVLVAGATIWTFTGFGPDRVNAFGTFVSRTELHNVRSPAQGVVSAANAAIGSAVDAGQVVATIKSLDGQETYVRSFEKGRVVALMKSPGARVEPGDQVATIETVVRDSDQVRAFIPAALGRFCRPGMPVEMTVAGFQRVEYGALLGTIKAISAYPLPGDVVATMVGGDAGGAAYELSIQLTPDARTASGFAWSNGTGPPVRLKQGVPVVVGVVPGRRSTLGRFRSLVGF